MRVVLDSNILARATPGKTGPARELVLLVTASPHLNILSPFLLSELSRVLRYDRLRKLHGLIDSEIDGYVYDIQAASLVVTLPGIASVVPHDPQDNPVVATAVIGQAEVLCTRDHHLLHPDVLAYCAKNNIQVLGDLELLRRLRTQAPRPPNP